MGKDMKYGDKQYSNHPKMQQRFAQKGDQDNMTVNLGLNENFPQHLMGTGPAQFNLSNLQSNQMGAMGIN